MGRRGGERIYVDSKIGRCGTLIYSALSSAWKHMDGNMLTILLGSAKLSFPGTTHPGGVSGSHRKGKGSPDRLWQAIIKVECGRWRRRRSSSSLLSLLRLLCYRTPSNPTYPVIMSYQQCSTQYPACGIPLDDAVAVLRCQPPPFVFSRLH